jgi:hypothetical protein
MFTVSNPLKRLMQIKFLPYGWRFYIISDNKIPLHLEGVFVMMKINEVKQREIGISSFYR